MADPANFEWILDEINLHKSSKTKEELLLKGAVCRVLHANEDIWVMYREVARNGELTQAAEQSMRGFYRSGILNVIDENIMSQAGSIGDEMTSRVVDAFIEQIYFYLTHDDKPANSEIEDLIDNLVCHQFEMFRQFVEWDSDTDHMDDMYSDANAVKLRFFWET